MSGYDVAIVGAGFAGTILARALVRQGARVLLVERGVHPRFALGESSTPLAGLSLERLAARHDLPDLRHLAAYGRWLRHLRHLRRGLKRGFTFFHHVPGARFRYRDDGGNRLLVAASPNDAIADSHWLRADVDTHLVARARDEEVDYRDRTTLDEGVRDARGWYLRGTRDGRRVRYRASFVVDGSGPGGFLARALPIAAGTPRARVDTQLIYAHLAGLPTFAQHADDGHRANDAPYPESQAAVHHLLADRGWVYVLPFDHDVASVGLVLRRGSRSPGLRPRDAVRRALGGVPSLAAQLEAGRVVRPWRTIPRVQHRLAQAAGPRWFLLPHAFAFVDPMFSTGMAWSLLAVERLATLLASDDDADSGTYDRRLQQEADQIETLIATAYAAQSDFTRFVAVASLYFATVSHAETCQRLTPSADDAWRGLLGADDAQRRDLFTEARRLAAARDVDLTRWVAEQIDPFDVIGLDTMQRNQLGVDLDVLVRRADRVGLDRSTVLAAVPRLRGEPTPEVAVVASSVET